MYNTGLLNPKRYELINGELILRMPKELPHMRGQALLGVWLRGLFGALFVMQQPSINVHPDDNPMSEPEPDVAVLNRSVRDLTLQPGPEDLRLVAEVSSSTLSFDLTVKTGLYARAGIVEYWVLDLEKRRLIAHRRPENGRYADVVAYSENERVATLAAEAQVLVADLL